MKNFIIIDDFFLENGVLGGGELNNGEVYEVLKSRGHKVSKINSHLVTLTHLSKNLRANFIVGNFVNLSEACKDELKKKHKYIIYEHDHKYLKSRDPSSYESYIAPKEEIVNRDFYESAIAVLCQSELHESVVFKNLKINNIYNVSGNLWSDEILDYIESLKDTQKAQKYTVMNSLNPVKSPKFAIRYCNIKDLDYELVPMMKYKSFLKKLSENEGFIFFPNVLETLNRVCVEARMMNCKVITNKKVGATSEPWFKLKGKDLIDFMRKKKQEVGELIEGIFEK